MSFTCLPPIKGSVSCLTCGCGAHDTFPMGGIVAVGFGSAFVTKDDKTVFDEQIEDFEAQRANREPNYWTGQDCENAAIKDPDHDWRIHKFAPLYSAEYQRQGAGHWVLVRKDEGFA